MQINKFTKKKNGMYNILLEDDSTITVYEDIILKYDLLLKKKIDDDLKNKIMKENEIYVAYNMAIKYITTRMRSKNEVTSYLSSREFSKDTIAKVIIMLEKDRYIDDISYAEFFINDKINLSNDGPNKIVNELLNRGINKSIIEDKISLFKNDLELEKINKIADKLINTNRNKSSYILKNKINNYLINLGYTKSLINDVLSSKDFSDDSDIYKKEYNKVYNKLAKKYSGKELEYKIRQKMYNLGFRNNDDF